MEMKIVPTRPEYDSNDVFFYDDMGAYVGYGYQPKDGIPNRIFVTTCPVCRRENYMGGGPSNGLCAWCYFDPNNPEIKRT